MLDRTPTGKTGRPQSPQCFGCFTWVSQGVFLLPIDNKDTPKPGDMLQTCNNPNVGVGYIKHLHDLGVGSDSLSFPSLQMARFGQQSSEPTSGFLGSAQITTAP